MNDHQQPLLALRTVDQQGAQQRTVVQVEAALGVGVQGCAFSHVADLRLNQQGVGCHCAVFCLPRTLMLDETQAQRVVLFE